MTSQPSHPRPWPGEVVDLPGGVQVHLRRTEGPASSRDGGGHGTATALFVHGLGGSSHNWTDLMTELDGDVQGWAPDLPGYGESPPAPGGRHGVDTLNGALQALAELVVARAGGPVHVVGNSLGGLLATMLASRRPDLVRTLALLSPALPARRLPRDARLLALLAIPRVGEAALRRNRLRPVEEQAQMALVTVYGDTRDVPAERVAQAVSERTARLEQPWADEVFLDSLRSLIALRARSRSIWADAGRVSAPTLVVHGGRDRLVHADQARRWQSALPRARLVLLPTSGHVPQMERPALVARLLREHWSL